MGAAELKQTHASVWYRGCAAINDGTFRLPGVQQVGLVRERTHLESQADEVANMKICGRRFSRVFVHADGPSRGCLALRGAVVVWGVTGAGQAHTHTRGDLA